MIELGGLKGRFERTSGGVEADQVASEVSKLVMAGVIELGYDGGSNDGSGGEQARLIKPDVPPSLGGVALTQPSGQRVLELI